MTTFAPMSPPATPYPSEPSAAQLAARGRRPALIPHSSDLALSLSAASAALSAACYSPARDEKVSPGMWMLPIEADPAMPRFVDMTIPDGKRTPAEEIRGDVFSWVNAPETERAPDSRYLHTTPPQLDTDAPVTQLHTRRGTVTRPASPTDAAREEELERQKWRLDEAERDVRR